MRFKCGTNHFVIFELVDNVLNQKEGWYISEYSTEKHMNAHNVNKCNYSSTSSSNTKQNSNPFAFDDTTETEFWAEAKRFYEFRYNQVSNQNTITIIY